MEIALMALWWAWVLVAIFRVRAAERIADPWRGRWFAPVFYAFLVVFWPLQFLAPDHREQGQ